PGMKIKYLEPRGRRRTWLAHLGDQLVNEVDAIRKATGKNIREAIAILMEDRTKDWHKYTATGRRANRRHYRPLTAAPPLPTHSPSSGVGGPEQQLGRATWLWRTAVAARGTIVETSSRKPKYPHPAMVVAFGMPTEPEPGVLQIADDAVRGVQLTLLRADGTGKADTTPNKLTLGSCSGVPMVIAPPNDLLGLAIAEGVEDALSVWQVSGLGAWASGGASRLPALADAVPDYIDCVRVMVDADHA